ncbi:outer membrane protein assembly factor BamE domain-containing protein [Aquabacterium sp.]|uniref:outer membrane protein assembly factor BamE domain-containing protein n=1 Tax=Aquabacterium sp. TaxID=1872578 RepID=UPI002BBAB3CC|nr:outer membrane protein assembly factor BamE [Aquabacterium sp.]HSW07855.1 outer membrane protein assembly factor BamE [Aquabacterium sp.]
MKRLLTLLLCCLTLTACDQQRIDKLQPGVSVEADVRQQFGEPVMIVEKADGSKVFEYPRQPEGSTNYFITLGADGKLQSIRQALTPAAFAKVEPGMAQADVRRLLGRPASMQRFAMKPDQEVWDWRFLDGQQKKVFSVTFDREHRVLSSATADDPRETTGTR